MSTTINIKNPEEKAKLFRDVRFKMYDNDFGLFNPFNRIKAGYIEHTRALIEILNLKEEN